MKKIIYKVSSILFIITAFIFYNLELLNISPNNLPVSESYHNLYVILNENAYYTLTDNYTNGFLNNSGLANKFIKAEEQIQDEQEVDENTEGNTDNKPIEINAMNQYLYKGKLEADGVYYVDTSRVNLGGILLSLFDGAIDAVSNASQTTKMYIYHFISSILAIGVFVLIGYWLWKELGVLPCLFVYIGILGSIYLVPYGSGLSNSAFLLFLPLTAIMYILFFEDKNDKKIKGTKEFLIIFIVIDLNAMMGYEMILTIIFSTFVMYAYYAVSRKWSRKRLLSRIGRVSLASIAGIIFTLLVHFLQMTLYYGNSADALSQFKSIFANMTWGNTAARDFTPSITNLFREMYHYSQPYYTGKGLVFEFSLSVVIGLGTIAVLVIAISYFKGRREIKDSDELQSIYRKMMALVAAIAVSGIGGFITPLIAKNYCFNNIMKVLIVFDLPMTIMLCALIGYMLEKTVTSEI